METIAALVLLGLYLGGLGIFFMGYQYTTFRKKTYSRFLLSLGWPALWASSPRFRRNFRRALERDKNI